MLSLLRLAIIHDLQTDHYTSMDFKGAFGKLSFKATGQVELTKWVSLEREEGKSDSCREPLLFRGWEDKKDPAKEIRVGTASEVERHGVRVALEAK